MEHLHDALDPHLNRPKDTVSVRNMFDRIAPTYDLSNTVLSLGLHRLWAKRLLASLPSDSRMRCLDLCTGTGALVPGLASRYEHVTAADISPGMLEIGRRRHEGLSNVEWVEADAQQMPFPDNRFDVVTVAYGVRNLPDLSTGLREMLRVTAAGGELAILEFGQPTLPVWGRLFSFYSHFVIPFIGGALSGHKDAYRYLPKTSAAFPCGPAFERLLVESGWNIVSISSLCGGVAYLYRARKDPRPGA